MPKKENYQTETWLADIAAPGPFLSVIKSPLVFSLSSPLQYRYFYYWNFALFLFFYVKTIIIFPIKKYINEWPLSWSWWVGDLHFSSWVLPLLRITTDPPKLSPSSQIRKLHFLGFLWNSKKKKRKKKLCFQLSWRWRWMPLQRMNACILGRWDMGISSFFFLSLFFFAFFSMYD